MSEIRRSVEETTLRASFGQEISSGKSWTLSKLAGDASSREYYRLVDGTGKSFVLQVAEPFEASNAARHPFLAAAEILKSWRIDVPAIRAWDAAAGWILQEDLGDEPLQNAPSEKLYAKAIDWILALTAGEKPVSCVAPHFGWAFDEEKLQFEMGFTEEHLFAGILGRGGTRFAEIARPNSLWLAERPRILCHRDYHSRNLMIRGDRLVVIDFQDARMGPLSYDVASLLWDPYVRLSEVWRETLLKKWKEGLRSIDKPELRSALPSLEEELERMKIQRLLKAIGSYASFYNRKGRRDYLPAVRPAYDSVISSFERLKRLGTWKSSDAELLTLVQSIDLSRIDRLVG